MNTRLIGAKLEHRLEHLEINQVSGMSLFKKVLVFLEIVREKRRLNYALEGHTTSH